MRWPSSDLLAMLGAAAALSAPAGCALERERDGGGGVHPTGWIDQTSPLFHGKTLREAGYPLGDCRACHGDDYAGGAVAVSCASAGCHTQGVEACGTCHGEGTKPLPATGAHAAHAALCDDCHLVPKDARSAAHPDGAAEVVFRGVAAEGGAAPIWDAATRTCAGTYCHGSTTPIWEKPAEPIACDGCHGAPPASHARFAAGDLAHAPEACVRCHPAPASAQHIDGKVEVLDLACDACHGKGPLGAPPPALDGTLASAGAHARHLDETLSDRAGRVVACSTCHAVPAGVADKGHLDTTSPADVALPGDDGYDATTGRCVTACHWDREPGPAWGDTSGAARACDACHAFPPDKTRAGTPHPSVAGELSVCVTCHVFDPEHHVDGHVNFLP